MVLPTWLISLGGEDLDLLKRFVLASGSLKEVAKQYSVSYPTIRLRLDRLIQRITLLESPAYATGFDGLARAAHAQGKLDRETMQRLMRAHEREIELAVEQGNPIERQNLDLSSD
jgi:transposase